MSQPSDEKLDEVQIRENLVRTAVNFLQNPKVIHTPLSQKQKFLQRKGLTNEEIKKACELSGAYSQHEQIQSNPPPLPAPIPMCKNFAQLSFFDKLKEIVHSAAVFSIVGYVLYKIYETYIAPFFFNKKKRNLGDSVDELNKKLEDAVDDLKTSLNTVKTEVDRINYTNEITNERQLSELKSDIRSIKGLLLGRKQFPSVSNSPVVPPSIPAWQMSSVQADDPDGEADRKTEELEEVGSGSSSERDHCTKTSESSLEIIFSPKDCESSYHSKAEEDEENEKN